MSFLIDAYKGWSAEEAVQRHKAYVEYLENIKGDLPESAFKFASAPSHYQFLDHHCPHDGWVEYLKIWESASGDRKERRQTQIDVRLLGAFHDAYLDLNYKDVKSYTLIAELPAHPQGARKIGHGDWLIDEVRLSEPSRPARNSVPR